MRRRPVRIFRLSLFGFISLFLLWGFCEHSELLSPSKRQWAAFVSLPLANLQRLDNLATRTTQQARAESRHNDRTPVPGAVRPGVSTSLLGTTATAMQPVSGKGPSQGTVSRSTKKLADPKAFERRVESISHVIETALQHSRVIPSLTEKWKAFVRKIEPKTPPAGTFAGHGVVICGGGMLYFSSAMAIIKLLRSLKCSLPIELWLARGEELPRALEAELKEDNVFVRNAAAVQRRLDTQKRGDRFYGLKAISLVFSSFQHALLIDADNFPVRNPTHLFESRQYRETGAIFWPDFWALNLDPGANHMWSITEVDPSSANGKAMEQESGQVLVDKQRHWIPLLLMLHMNMEHAAYHAISKGDKETFHFAWRALGASFTMIETPTASAGKRSVGRSIAGVRGSTMVQHDFDGRALFFHRNLRKIPTGFHPMYPEHLAREDRSWQEVNECVRQNPRTCGDLLSWEDGMVAWPAARGMRTKTVEDVAGWDIELKLTQIFARLWDSEHYAAYMNKLLKGGLPGTYHASCIQCQMHQDGPQHRPTTLRCNCKSCEECAYSQTTLQNAVNCISIGNLFGRLACEDS